MDPRVTQQLSQLSVKWCWCRKCNPDKKPHVCQCRHCTADHDTIFEGLLCYKCGAMVLPDWRGTPEEDIDMHNKNDILCDECRKELDEWRATQVKVK